MDSAYSSGITESLTSINALSPTDKESLPTPEGTGSLLSGGEFHIKIQGSEKSSISTSVDAIASPQGVFARSLKILAEKVRYGGLTTPCRDRLFFGLGTKAPPTL